MEAVNSKLALCVDTVYKSRGIIGEAKQYNYLIKHFICVHIMVA